MRRLLGSRLELAFTAGLLAWAVAEALLIDSRWPVAARLTFALLATLPLAVRHLHPFVVLAWAAAALLLDGLLTFLPFTAVTPLPGVALALFAVTAYGCPRRRAGAVVAVTLVAMPPLFALSEQEVTATLHDVIVFTVMQLLAVSAGWAVRTRREEAERAAAVASGAGAAEAERLRRDLESERRRIARELHAIVTRDLAAIAGLAREARARLGDDERRALELLSAIARTTTAALDELRRLLQVLRTEGGGEGPPARSTPALAVAGARARGWDVTLAERGAPLKRAAGRAPAELAAGRVVEELLSGSGDDDGRGETTVALRRRPDAVAVVLHGRGRPPAPLRDPARLASAGERARLHGGTLRSRRGLRGWRIEVALPLGDVTTTAVAPPAATSSRAVDALAALLALCTLAIEQRQPGVAPSGWISGIALLVLPLLLLRSRAPLAGACLLVLGFWLRSELDGVATVGVTIVPVIVFAPYAAAAHAVTVSRAIAGGVVVGAVALAAVGLRVPDSALTDLPIVACVVMLSWLAGWYVRGSSLQALGLRLDARRQAEAAPERLRASLEAERARVARDLHDVVAHGVSLIGLLAAGARATLPRDPSRARRALDDLDDAVAGTHVELARLLEALRAGDEAAVGAASLADLDALAGDARRAGQPIALALDRAALAAAPAGVLASACRIVQEALTNARKHADGAPVEVRLSVERGELLVDVRNAAPATPCAGGDGARQGIAGMRERARLLDGELEAAPTVDGGFRVHARLPCAAAA